MAETRDLLERVEECGLMRWLRALAPVGGLLTLGAIGIAAWQLALARETAEREARLSQTRMLVEIQSLAVERRWGASSAIKRYLEQLVTEAVPIHDLYLQGAQLKDVALPHARLSNVVFADIERLGLQDAHLENVTFNGSDIPDLSRAELQDVYFRYPALGRNSSLQNARLTLVSFFFDAQTDLPDLARLPREGAQATYVRLAAVGHDEDRLVGWARKFCTPLSNGQTATRRPEAYSMFEPTARAPDVVHIFSCESP